VTTMLPRLRDMINPDEMTLTMEQELRLMDDRQRRSRWWIAQEGAPIPGPRAERTSSGYDALTEPWLNPWTQLNDPAADSMAGVVVLNQEDAAAGILIWVNPTEEAEAAWQAAWEDPTEQPYMLGVETAIRVPEPAVDYRAVFRHVTPLVRISAGAVRWRFSRPAPGQVSWDVMTGGWMPERHKQYGQQPPRREPVGELSPPEPSEDYDWSDGDPWDE
jgi:hypothetical protein